MLLPDDYCRTKAAPVGSDLHYSLLSLAELQQRAVIAVHAFDQELYSIVERRNEQSIAERKLAWWYEETERLFSGRPQHPISQALTQALELQSLSRQAFHERLESAQMDLDYNAYPTFEQLLQYAHHAGGSIALLHTEAVGYSEPQTKAFAHEWGIALLLFQRLCNVRNDALKGRFYIPENELQRFGNQYDDLLQTQTSASLQQSFHLQADRIRAYAKRALEYLYEAERYQQRSHIVRIELSLRLLDEIETTGFHLLQQQISLTPLRKLWIAWRTARRERRRQRSFNPQVIESKSA